MAARIRDVVAWMARWWRRVSPRVIRLRVHDVSSMDDVPDDMSLGDLFIVGPPAQPKWVVLTCPCGCGRRIYANLMRKRRPVWRLIRRGSLVTLFPSLWVPRQHG